MHKSIICFLIAISCLFYHPIIAAQNISYCNHSIMPTNDYLGYKDRGNRCEGFYEARVGNDLDLVSLTINPIKYECKPNIELTVFPVVPVNQTLHIRAKAIHSRIYYQMDSNLSYRDKLKWPLKDVLYDAKLTSDRIGICGWYEDNTQLVYVPLTVLQNYQENILPTQEIIMIIRTEVDLDSLVYRYAKIEKKQIKASFEGWQPVISWQYAGTPIEIRIPVEIKGRICVEIRARSPEIGWLGIKRYIIQTG
ncbi:MAG: hypothetical protein JW866_06315 [Ignavibacteriales bacterium]|nr:hypothetical protein [Ignavibacteriales bacterium]